MRKDLERVPVVDEAVIQRLRALRDQVARPGEDVLGELLALFVNDTAVRLQTIRAALASGDAEGRRLAAHALKGSAGNVGARRVAELAAHVEKNPATPADIDALEEEVAAAVQVLEERMR
jgi:HPt (histidine-containing phosphotransfer) domain-containing protein